MRIILVPFVILVCLPMVGMQTNKLKLFMGHPIRKETRFKAKIPTTERATDACAYRRQLKSLEWASGCTFDMTPKDPLLRKIIERYSALVLNNAYMLRSKNKSLASEKIEVFIFFGQVVKNIKTQGKQNE